MVEEQIELNQKVTVEDIINCYQDYNEVWARRLQQTFPMSDYEMEDIMQDGMLRILEKYESCPYEGRNNASLATWCYTVIRNHTINYIRKMNTPSFGSNNEVPFSRIKNPDCIDDESDHDVLNTLSLIYDNGDTILENMEQQEMYNTIVAVIHEMPPKVKDAFLHRVLYGMDYHDVAEAIDSTYGSVRLLVHRARKILKKRLPEEYGEVLLEDIIWDDYDEKN